MTKNLIKFAIFSGIVIFSIFLANYCFAAPTITAINSPACSGATVSYVAVLLDWDVASTPDHYELYYQEEGASGWGDRYPSGSSDSFLILGLQPSTPYKWYLVSCGNSDCSDSFSSVSLYSYCTFLTEDMPPGLPGGPGGPGPYVPIPLVPPTLCTDLWDCLEKIFQFLFAILMTLVSLLIIYAGYLFVTSAGNATQVSKARTVILFAVIAGLVGLLAKAIPGLIRTLFGG